MEQKKLALLEELDIAQTAVAKTLNYPKALKVTEYADLTIALDLIRSIRERLCRQ